MLMAVHRPGWKLTALRDVITCEADANMTAQNQSRPSGYFYIEVSSTICLLELVVLGMDLSFHGAHYKEAVMVHSP